MCGGDQDGGTLLDAGGMGKAVKLLVLALLQDLLLELLCLLLLFQCSLLALPLVLLHQANRLLMLSIALHQKILDNETEVLH